MAGLMVVLAHPDDEILGSGGTIAKAVAEGRPVQLVCATRGEEGEIHKEGVTRAELGAVREAELRCAARELGVEEVIFLGYRDSGMVGSPAAEHPDALVQAPRDQVAERIVELIRAFEPEVVVTFDSRGGYGHPDHIAIHHATTLAFTDAGDAYRFPIAGTPWAPSRLYFLALTNSFFREAAQILRRRGIERPHFDRPLEEWGYPDEQITTVVDVEEFVERKERALACHETQLSPTSLFGLLPVEDRRGLFARETFIRAHPLPVAGLRETSLFESEE